MIHIRTQYLGPEELLVAAKIALQPCTTIEDVARGDRRGGAAGAQRGAGGPADLPRAGPGPLGRPRLTAGAAPGPTGAVLAPRGTSLARAVRATAHSSSMTMTGDGEAGVTTERRRRLVFAGLLAVAVLGAVAFMASVLLDDPLWRTVTQVVGLGAALVTATSLVVKRPPLGCGRRLLVAGRADR